MSTRNTSLTLAVLAMLSACALEPAPKPADYGAEALGGVHPPDQWSADGATAEPVAGSWLVTFGDPRLDALVTEAMANNLDLKVAAARVQVASEYVNLADSTLWPQVNLLARGGGEMGGDASGLNGVGLYANWELDLWGRLRSARSATEATYGSAVADAEYARQSVAAMVAKAYFLAVEATLQLRLAQDTVATSQQLVSFAEQRQRVGKGDGYDTALARGNVETYRDTVEKLTSIARASAACARGAGRTLSGGRCRGGNATGAAAWASPGRPAVGVAGAAPGRHCGRQTGRCCVLRCPGSQGGAVAKHFADGIGQRHLERAVRAQESR